MAPTAASAAVSTKPRLPQAVQALEPSFFLETPKLQQIVKAFRAEFSQGLTSYGKDVAMIPSYITGVPDGNEEGTFLALDLGGTNLRVCEVRLLGSHKFTIKQQKYKVSDDLKRGDARDLFDYIAESVDSFLTEIGTESDSGKVLHLGFTFSFPVEQTALDAGTILTWTKGFSATNAIGNDVVKLLQDSLDRKHIHVRCSALVNDTVGTMLSSSYQHGPALIGAIFGTGTNGAYLEDLSKITKLGESYIKEQTAKVGSKMVINTEWGALDNSRAVLPITLFDGALDRLSINPHKQAFEKLISGMYLGEITRNILLHFIDSSLLFSGYSTPELNAHYGIDTSFLSFVEAAADIAPKKESTSSSDLTPAQQAIKELITKYLGVKAKHISQQDVELVLWAVQAVGSRAAALSACAIACIVLHTQGETAEDVKNVDLLDVGVDGSVAELYPHFQERVNSYLAALLGEEYASKIRLVLAKDGSGVGAALAALQAKKDLDALAAVEN
ncbi:hexokinase [Phaffia rhodozyma]|uniref:Phosphotransferase n=1 Tax=Phaffia rhodozyma TaxID=264483 RepID=A0A0F7SGR4_PHARH|nr:hexokinase [Phaffia rhodozyma]